MRPRAHGCAGYHLRLSECSHCWRRANRKWTAHPEGPENTAIRVAGRSDANIHQVVNADELFGGLANHANACMIVATWPIRIVLAPIYTSPRPPQLGRKEKCRC